MAGILIDSDVLVWLTSGHVGAARWLHALDAWRISTVTYIELAQGCRDRSELARLKKGGNAALSFVCSSVSTPVSAIA